MNRIALLAASAAGLAVYAIAPAHAAVLPTDATETVTSCGNSRLQAGLATRVCAEITGTTVEFYGRVGLAGPPSPGGPAPAPRELLTTLSVEVAGAAAPRTQFTSALFTASNLEVRGTADTVPCGSTVRATFGVASYPYAANPVVHEVTVTC
ncbi:hypothetical protein ABZY44_35950 [Streptomyces sp. NPDC006544]|uniref:hypothetical protein n=1 Tax=Streptomyces sp. NPDC006544 TaxID=3154583 RepID=UPI0033B584C8